MTHCAPGYIVRSTDRMTACEMLFRLHPMASVLEWYQPVIRGDSYGATYRDVLARPRPGAFPHLYRVFDCGHVLDRGTEADAQAIGSDL